MGAETDQAALIMNLAARSKPAPIMSSKSCVYHSASLPQLSKSSLRNGRVPSPEVASISVPSPDMEPPLSILLVDENPDDLQATEHLLREVFRDGLRLDLGANWADGHSKLLAGTHDVALIAHSLGKQSGNDLIREAARAGYRTPCILLAEQDLPAIDQEATRAGAADYLAKAELDSGKLERAIRYAVSIHRRYLSLSAQAEELEAAHDHLNEQSHHHARLTERLYTAQIELEAALNRAEQSEKRYRLLAEHDTLTGLGNRNLFRQKLLMAIQEASRAGEALSVILIDLDSFKSVNDTLGNPTGDALLLQASQRLCGLLRADDILARLGSDEFAAVLKGFDSMDEVVRMAEKSLQALSLPFNIGGRDLFISASIGIALMEGDAKDPGSLLKNANAALSRAKTIGRGGYHIFDETLDAEYRNRSALAADLRRALENEEFVLHYQPKVSAETGELTGAEALVRWEHPERGCLSPLEFIGIAEATGLMNPLGEWVLRAACRQYVAWRQAGLSDLQISVNISPAQMRQGGIVDTVRRVLRDTGLTPPCLELEITESFMFENLELAIEELSELRKLGVTVTVDDFGTGYSSLAYLKKLPVDRVKIDRTFISHVPDDACDTEIVKMILGLTRLLSLQAVGEGVETATQASFLRQHGCQDLQGFYFARPMDPVAFRAWVESNRRDPRPLAAGE